MSDPLHDFLFQVKSMWEDAVKNIMASRLKPIINKEITLSIEDGPSYTIHLLPDRIDISNGKAIRPDARIQMNPMDWQEVISGKVSIMSVVLAGRCPYPKDERLPISKLSIIFQSLATTREEVA